MTSKVLKMSVLRSKYTPLTYSLTVKWTNFDSSQFFSSCVGYQQQFRFQLEAVNIFNIDNFINVSRSNIKLQYVLSIFRDKCKVRPAWHLLRLIAAHDCASFSETCYAALRKHRHECANYENRVLPSLQNAKQFTVYSVHLRQMDAL